MNKFFYFILFTSLLLSAFFLGGHFKHPVRNFFQNQSNNYSDCIEIKKSNMYLVYDGGAGVSGVIRNTCGKEISMVYLEFNFYDNDGVSLGMGNAIISNIGIGELAKFDTLSTNAKNPASFKLKKITTN